MLRKVMSIWSNANKIRINVVRDAALLITLFSERSGLDTNPMMCFPVRSLKPRAILLPRGRARARVLFFSSCLDFYLHLGYFTKYRVRPQYGKDECVSGCNLTALSGVPHRLFDRLLHVFPPISAKAIGKLSRHVWHQVSLWAMANWLGTWRTNIDT